MTNLGNRSPAPTELVTSVLRRPCDDACRDGDSRVIAAGSHASPVTRRAFLMGAGAFLLTGGLSVGWTQENKPLRVGMILPEHGPLQAEAKSLVAGFDLFFKEKGPDAGRVEVLKRDAGHDESKVVEALTDLVMNKRVEILVAPPSLDATEKIVRGISGANVVLFVTHPAVRLVAGELCLPGSFRLPGNSYQAVQPLAPWVLKNVGKKVFLTGEDDAQGNEEADFFAYAFERAGGAFVDRMMVSGKPGKFKELLDAIAKSKPEVVFAGFQKDQAVSFLKAYRSASPSLGQPVIGPESLTSFPKTLTALGKTSAGIRTQTTLKAPQDLVEKTRKKLGREISDAARAAQGYDLANIVWSAAKANIDLTAHSDLITFIRDIEITGPRGAVRFDKNHEPILETMIQEWVPGDSGAKRKIIEDLGPCSSLDFGCGRVGFPKRPEAAPTEDIPLDSGEEEIFGQ